MTSGLQLMNGLAGWVCPVAFRQISYYLYARGTRHYCLLNKCGTIAKHCQLAPCIREGIWPLSLIEKSKVLSCALLHLIITQWSEADKEYSAHFIDGRRKINCLLEHLGDQKASGALVLWSSSLACPCGGALMDNAVVLGWAGTFRILPHPG